MAYEIHTQIDADGAPTDAQTKFDNWYSNHSFVLTEREQSYTENAARDDGTLQAYHEFRVFLSLQEDLQTALDDLENQFGFTSWRVAHVRRNDAELDLEPLATDATYYDPQLTEGLREVPDVSFVGHTVEHGDIGYVIGGTEQTVTAGSYTFDESSDEQQTTLYADADGSLNESAGVKVADVEVHPGRIVTLEPASQPVVEKENWTARLSKDSPPTHFADKANDFPDRIPSEPFDRSKVTQETETQVYDAIAAHPDTETRELATTIADLLLGNMNE